VKLFIGILERSRSDFNYGYEKPYNRIGELNYSTNEGCAAIRMKRKTVVLYEE